MKENDKHNVEVEIPKNTSASLTASLVLKKLIKIQCVDISVGIVEERNTWAEFIYSFVTHDVRIHGGRHRVHK